MSSSDKLVAELNAHFKKTVIMKASAVAPMTRIKTSSLGLNLELGGGIPIARITEIYGLQSAGKTSLSLDIVAQAQKMFKDKACLWIDQEGAFDGAWAKKLGVDLERLEIARPETGEECVDAMDACVRSGDFALVVLDSIPATTPKVEVEESMEKQQMGVHARMMGKMIRKLQSAMNARPYDKPNMTTVILINQIRMKIGVMYGNPETTPGGLAVPYAASLRINLRNGDKLTFGKGSAERAIGQEVKYKVEKNKTAPPKTHGSFLFYTHDVPEAGVKAGTIDLIDELANYGVIFGLIEQSGAWFTVNGTRLQGFDKVKDFLKKNPKEVERLKVRLYGLTDKERSERRGHAEPSA